MQFSFRTLLWIVQTNIVIDYLHKGVLHGGGVCLMIAWIYIRIRRTWVGIIDDVFVWMFLRELSILVASCLLAFRETCRTTLMRSAGGRTSQHCNMYVYIVYLHVQSINSFCIPLCLNPTFFGCFLSLGRNFVSIAGLQLLLWESPQAEQVVSLDLRWWRGLSLADCWCKA